MAISSTSGSSAGVYWFNGPEEFAQRLSLAASALQGKAADVVNAVGEHAVERMEDIIQAGGIEKSKTPKSRIISHDMIDSVGSTFNLNGRGRAQGEFGFINSPPSYTPYQELGTLGGGGSNKGIAPMRAYETARQEANVEMSNLVQKTQWLMYRKDTM